MSIVDRQPIRTGSLEIDGSPARMEVEVAAVRTYDIKHPLDRETYLATSNRNGYDSTRPLAVKAIRTDMGLVAGSIKRALRDGHRVTAQTSKLGEGSFSKWGPVLFGWSKHHSLHSVGRFGLKGMLGLRSKQQTN